MDNKGKGGASVALLLVIVLIGVVFGGGFAFGVLAADDVLDRRPRKPARVIELPPRVILTPAEDTCEVCLIR